MIKVENLVKKYGELAALDGVSFELNEGEVVGILGPNGAGKTTLLRTLVMFLDPDGGKVTIDNLDIANPLHQHAIKSKIGYLPEHAPLYEDMTVTEYLTFIGKMHGIDADDLYEKLSSIIEKCGLKEKRNPRDIAKEPGSPRRLFMILRSLFLMNRPQDLIPIKGSRSAISSSRSEDPKQ
jgi:ABC-2 type transport system ATP-binding protein